VKNKRFIFKSLTLLLGFAFLAGSMGITIIVHNCPACSKFTVNTGIFLSPAEPEDQCCEAAENHCSPDAAITFEGTCCHFKVENIKLASFVPVIPESFSGPWEFCFPQYISPVRTTIAAVIYPADFHNKHGGRYLVTYNRQLLS